LPLFPFLLILSDVDLQGGLNRLIHLPFDLALADELQAGQLLTALEGVEVARILAEVLHFLAVAIEVVPLVVLVLRQILRLGQPLALLVLIRHCFVPCDKITEMAIFKETKH